ncbi:MAG: hypothetical protein AAB289_14980, partial [Chloroflexota bacterium]
MTIDQNVTVLTYTTEPVTFGSLTLGDAAATFAPTLVLSTGTLGAGGVIINPGATLTQGTTYTIVVGSVTMYSGSVLKHKDNASTRQYVVALQVIDYFDLQAGSSIAVDGLGYVGGSGPGAGGSAFWGAGGGHGGRGGGDAGEQGGGTAYDSLINPSDLGSGGGNSGSAGGGAAFLTVGGVFTLNGAVSANGGTTTGAAAAGGAGGTIKMTIATLAGTGIIRANGGFSTQNGGSGGGGRIALNVTASDTSNLSVLAANAGQSGFYLGSAGPIYVQKPDGSSRLIISNPSTPRLSGNTPLTSAIVGAATLSVSSLTISNANVTVTSIDSIVVVSSANFGGNSTIANAQGILQLPAGETIFPSGMNVTLGTITAGGSLTLNSATLIASSMTVVGN